MCFLFFWMPWLWMGWRGVKLAQEDYRIRNRRWDNGDYFAALAMFLLGPFGWLIERLEFDAHRRNDKDS